MINIVQDFQQELETFFDDLNWTYILIYAFVLYGIRYKQEFDWYNELLSMNKVVEKFKVWIAGIIIIIIFSLFKELETHNATAGYISQLLRSWIVVIVFNSIISKNIEDSTNKK